MIKITDDWALEKDPYCLILKHRTILGEKSRMPGREVWKAEGFYRDVPQLVKGLLDRSLLSTEKGMEIVQAYYVSLKHITNMVEKHVSEAAEATIS